MADEPDRDQLRRDYLELARHEARKAAAHCRMPVEELVQEASLALCQATDHYDPSQFPEMPFGAFVRIRIRNHLREVIRADNGPVKLPDRLARARRRCLRAVEVLEAMEDLNPPLERIAELAKVDVETAREALAWSPHEAPIESFATMDPEPDQAVEPLAIVHEVLGKCTETGQRLLSLMLGLDGDRPVTLPAAARRLGIPVERARILHDSACLTIANEMRRRGWTERAWTRRITSRGA